jgi:hypothetical protein
MSNFVAAGSWELGVVKFSTWQLQLQVLGAVKFYSGWVAAGPDTAPIVKFYTSCASWNGYIYYIYIPFYYTKNLKKSQVRNRVKFSGADILLQLKF